MDAAALRDLFVPFGAVDLRRMFGGHGIYAADDAGQLVMFALEADGEIYLKADADMQKLLEAAGSRPFVDEGSGRRVTMSYWLLPEAAHDEAEELCRWCALALAAASRAANRKTQARLGAPRRGRGVKRD